MAKIFPFRGIRYNPKRVDVSKVVSEPYDKITPVLQKRLYQRHPQNIVRIIKGKEFADDTDENNQYTRARDFLNEWLEEGILIKEDEPAIYIYEQEYSIKGTIKTRMGFIALAQLGRGIRPHERTLTQPKIDRLNLMRSTAAQFGQIFTLYLDSENKINDILNAETHKQPDINIKTEDDGICHHKVWIIKNSKTQTKVIEEMKDKDLYIADGHHRYEAALNYRDEMLKAGRGCLTCTENYNNLMMTFVNAYDKGLTILPTHRLIFDIPKGIMDSLMDKISTYFSIKRIGKDSGEGEGILKKLVVEMTPQGESDHRFGMYLRGAYYLLILRSKEDINDFFPDETSQEWRGLDVSILHAVILERILGIGANSLRGESNVAYERNADEAIKGVHQGRYQAAFFLNPTRIEQVITIASNGEMMPPKSTDFYPKIITGLVINKIALKG